MNAQEIGNEKCVTVYTCRGRDRILREGGSQAWRIDMPKASKRKYLVCVQNRNQTWGQATAEHQSAFLIAKISSVTKSTEEDAGDRSIIKISEFADIAVPNSWDGNRNPVAYTKLSDYGIHTRDDLEDLAWTRLGSTFNVGEVDPQKMPGDDYVVATIDVPSSPATDELSALSIDDAKRGLALKFGVGVQQIDITIRG
ncbi:hypothetical protein OH708_01055 [Pseudomonas capsici]|uniref:hypothetical protein n=1 Tax=Pseudomonas capsici TaxID=2810614 RepID=UPI0021F174D6|nr:hypothetical protein [Pseudomonas capsici]MCV4286484.1 hypothetical protein [Pseudomonas capsici]